MIDRAQFVAERSADFGVQGQYLDGELCLVDHALTRPVATVEKLQIFKSVIASDAVHMMDGFFGEQIAADVLRHDVSVFEHGVLHASDEAGNSDPDVTVSLRVFLDVPTVKARESRIALIRSFALAIAKALLHVYATARFAPTALFFTALFASKPLAFHRVFATSKVGARHAAIHRVFTKFFSVGGDHRRFVRERFAAFFAGKIDHRYLCSDPAVDALIRGDTTFGAKSLMGVTRFYREVRLALFAGFNDRHGFVSYVEFSSGLLVR